MADVDTEQITRSDGLPSESGQRIRECNNRLRQNGKARSPEFTGQRLDAELVDPSRREMPNRETPTDATWENSTFGTESKSAFTRSGELKGTKQSGKTNNPGRTSQQTERVKKLLDNLQQRRSTGTSPIRKPTAKQRKSDQEMKRIRDRRNR